MSLNKKINHFDSILHRLEKISSKNIEIETPYTLQTSLTSYPLIKITTGTGNIRRALISGGIHGNEPSGIETILYFFENDFYKDYTDNWEITFLPCINPYGYEYGTRENHEKRDLNRLFKADDPPLEVLFAQSILDLKFDLNLELHEDDESHGYYLYQKSRNPKYQKLGLEILKSVEKIMPINTDEEIDGSPANQGIISKDLDIYTMDWWPMALYGFNKGAKLNLTLEASTQYKLKTRIAAHTRAIKTALIFFQKE